MSYLFNVSYGLMNQIVHNINNTSSSDRYSYKSHYQEIIDGSVILLTLGDIVRPECIVVEQDGTDIKIKDIMIYAGSSLVVKVDVAFMRQLYPDMVTFNNNKAIYKLNFDKFCVNYGMLILCVRGEDKIVIKINYHDQTSITKVEVLSTYKLESLSSRRNMMNNEQRQIILQHQVTELESCPRNLIQDIDHGGPINGIFIEISSGISNICSIKITANNNNILTMDYVQVNYYAKKFNDNLLFLPFTPGIHMFSKNIHGSLNLTSIDDVKVYLSGTLPLDTVKFHTIAFNAIVYGLNVYTQYAYTQYETNNVHPNTDVSIIYKPYLGGDVCVISLCNIEKNILYTDCNVCDKVFIKQHLDIWLNINHTCPHCRSTWQNRLYVYKNCDEAE